MIRCVRWLWLPLDAFDDWVRTPVDPRPLAFFRFWFGFLCLVNLLLLWNDLPMWLGNDGVLPPQTHLLLQDGTRFNLYMFTGYNDFTITLIRWCGLAGGLGLLAGFFPRVSACAMWLAVSSFSWRNMNILHSGDNLIRIGCFFLMFAHSGEAFTLRRWIATRRAGVRLKPFRHIPAWPQRILQLQLCVAYFVAGMWKATGVAWQSGTAVGTVLQLGEFQRFPIPDWVMTPIVSQLMTHGTLLFELGFPFLIWIPSLRMPVLVVGIVFHAGLEWTMNVQLFQWLITAYYILFLGPLFSRSTQATAIGPAATTAGPACSA